MKNKLLETRKIILGLLFIFLLIMFLFLYYNNLKKNLVIQNEFESEKIISLNPEKTIYFEDIGLLNITCTGLTYDSLDNSFWVADYGSISKDTIPKPRLIEINFELNEVIKIIPIYEIINDQPNVQGISYDTMNDSILVATGKYIYNINKNGEEINHYDLGKYAKYSANGIAYNNKDNTIWTLLYSKYLLQYDTTGKLKNKTSINYKDQDQIFINPDSNHIFISIGADYFGNNNFILEFDLNNYTNYKLYRVNNSYAIEGISIIGEKLFVVNDGFYHSAKIKKSYINIYDLESKK